MAKVTQYDKTAVVELDQDDLNNPETMAGFQTMMDAWQDAMIEETGKVARELEVSENCASSVIYLRTRSRWTQEKEDQLIQWDREGTELPNVFSGEF